MSEGGKFIPLADRLQPLNGGVDLAQILQQQGEIGDIAFLPGFDGKRLLEGLERPVVFILGMQNICEVVISIRVAGVESHGLFHLRHGLFNFPDAVKGIPLVLHGLAAIGVEFKTPVVGLNGFLEPPKRRQHQAHVVVGIGETRINRYGGLVIRQRLAKSVYIFQGVAKVVNGGRIAGSPLYSLDENFDGVLKSS